MNAVERNLRKSIGRKIKLARTRTKITQEELAERLSLSPRYISQLERGIAFGSATTITNICKVLGINSDFLFSDIIQNKSVNLIDVVDTSFLEDYVKLNSYNKVVVDAITHELVRLQNDDNAGKRAYK